MAPLIVTPKLYAPVPPSIASAEYIVVTDTGRLIAALNTVGIVSFPHCSVQWIYLQDEKQRILPISFSNAAFSAVVSHFGTNADTAAIITDLNKNSISIAVGVNSSNFAYAVIVGY